MAGETSQAPPVTPSQAAESAVASVIAEQRAEGERRLADSLDIVDPGRPKPPPETPPASAAPSKPQLTAGASVAGEHTQDLLYRAGRLGIVEADAREYSPALLRKTIERMERQEQFNIDPEYDSSPRSRQPAQAPPQPAPAPAPKRQLPKLDPAKYEPDLVAAWDAQQQYLLEQDQLLAKQQEQLQQFGQTWQQAQQQAAQRESLQQVRTLEGLIAKDADFKDVLGEGPSQSLAGTRFFAERQRLAQVMDGLVNAGAVNAGDIEALYKMAKNALHGDRVKQSAERQVTEQVAERARNASGQFVSKPTATERSNELPHGPERARLALAAYMRNANGG